MNRNKRYTWYYVVVVVLVFYISFFFLERKEISDVDILLVVGVDKEVDGYRITGLYNKNGGSDESSGGTQLMEGKGVSFYAAYNDMVQKNQKNVSIAHNSFYIFSEAAAKGSMKECLDFIGRDQTVKMNANIYLYQGGTLNSLLKKSIENKMQLQDVLKGISAKREDELKKVDNTINYVNEMLEEEGKVIYLPYLVMNQKNIYVNGYGAIKEDRLVLFLDEQQSLTLDFLRNRVRTYPVYLKNQVNVEITDSQVRNEVKISNGNIIFTIHVWLESEIREVTSNDHVFVDYYMNQIRNLQNSYMAYQITDLIQSTKSYKLDVVGASDLLRTTYNNDWETISSDWNNFFSKISYQYIIESQTAQSFVVAD